jgi:histone H4
MDDDDDDDDDDMDWAARGATPGIQRRIANIKELRRRCGVSQSDAVQALNSAGDDVALACRLLPQVCADSSRHRDAARRRQRDDKAAISFSPGDEVMVRGLQSRPELNGGLGQVGRFDSKKGRYIVLLERTGTTVAVKAINLEPLDDGGLADQESSSDSECSSEEGVVEEEEKDPDQGEEPEPQPQAASAQSAVEEEKQLAEFLSQLGIGASAASDYAAALVAEGFDTTVAFASLTAEELRDDFGFKRGHLRMVEHEREREPEPEPEPESPVLDKQAASEVLLQRQRRRRQLIGSGTGSSLQSDVVTTPDFSEAIAGHVQPGATLAKFAMVCREWWSVARVLPAYHSPWDAEYQLWRTAGSQRREPGSQAWPQYMEAALEWQLARYLCRLPELEPDLQSLVLMERAEHYDTRLRDALSQKAGRESEDEIHDLYYVEMEVVRSLNLPFAKRQEVLRNHPEARRRRSVLRNCIHDISDAAFRRLARLGGVGRFSRLLYDEARGGLKRCLEIFLHGVLWYSQHACRRNITSTDVAHTLQLHGRPVCSLIVSTSGFFDRKPHDDESDDAIEEDDLTHPQPQQQILAYVSAFASLISEIQQDFMVRQFAMCLACFVALYSTRIFSLLLECEPLLVVVAHTRLLPDRLDGCRLFSLGLCYDVMCCCPD